MTEVTAPARRVPYLGAEVLDLLLRLGPLTNQQVQTLLPASVGERRIRQLLAALRSAEKVVSPRRNFRFYEAARGSAWTMVHELTDEGLSFVADRQDLHLGKARSLYRQVLREAIVEHALLRNEFYAEISRTLEGGPVSEALSGLAIETLCAESGMTPMELRREENKGRRFLNPDGLMTFVREGDPAFYRAYFLESDTGSEDMPWKIAGKADRYGEHWQRLLDTGEIPERIPSVLFLSPTVARTRWVREVIRQRALDPTSVFSKARDHFREHDLSLPSLVLFTNLPWLARYGPLGASYWSLGSNDLSPLVD